MAFFKGCYLPYPEEEGPICLKHAAHWQARTFGFTGMLQGGGVTGKVVQMHRSFLVVHGCLRPRWVHILEVLNCTVCCCKT